MEWTWEIDKVIPRRHDFARAKDAAVGATIIWLETWDTDFARRDLLDRLIAAGPRLSPYTWAKGKLQPHGSHIPEPMYSGTMMAIAREIMFSYTHNLEESYKAMSREELDQAYAINAGVDWHKAEIIAREIQRRAIQKFDKLIELDLEEYQ